jgi:hypothetical protein
MQVSKTAYCQALNGVRPCGNSGQGGDKDFWDMVRGGSGRAKVDGNYSFRFFTSS